MAQQSIEILKSRFRKGMYPTEQDFAALIDSFRHRAEQISISDIARLSEELNRRFPASSGEALQKSINEFRRLLVEMDATLERELAAIGYSKENLERILGIVEALNSLERTGVRTPCFPGVCEAVPEDKVLTASYTGLSTDEGCTVVYDTAGARFLLHRIVPQQGAIPRHDYYTNWGTGTEPSEPEAMGFIRDGFHWVPKPGVLYRATESPYGLWYFDDQGAHLLPGTEYQDAVTTAKHEQDIAAASRQSFDDMWMTAVGSYGRIDRENSPDKPYICNDIPMGFEEAKKVMMASAMTTTFYSFKFSTKRNAELRTLLPLHTATSENAQPSQTPNGLFRGLKNLEVVQFVGDFVSYNASFIFADCIALREIRGRIRLQNPTGIPKHFLNCSSLEEIRLFSLFSDPDLSACRNLSKESLLYMIEHALGGGYAITVHPNVFAKLTDEANTEWNAVLDKAAEKNITFATL